MATLVQKSKPTSASATARKPQVVFAKANAAETNDANEKAVLKAEVDRLKGMLAEMQARVDIVDPVSGLPRRTRFMELAGAEFARTRRYGHDLTLLVARIPGLKRIEDTRGSEAADQVVTAVSEMCVSSTRYGVDILGRIADDKIAMLLPETDLDGGNLCLERMRKLVTSMPIMIENEEIKVGLHVAARPLQEEHTSFVELLVTA